MNSNTTIQPHTYWNSPIKNHQTCLPLSLSCDCKLPQSHKTGYINSNRNLLSEDACWEWFCWLAEYHCHSTIHKATNLMASTIPWLWLVQFLWNGKFPLAEDCTIAMWLPQFHAFEEQMDYKVDKYQALLIILHWHPVRS